MNDPIQIAVQMLAGVCDGACVKDGTGFNRFDTTYGRRLATSDTWTDHDRYCAYRMIRKYRKQLTGFGIDYDALPKPVGHDRHPIQADRSIIRQNSHLEIRFEYDAEVVRLCRDIPGRRFEGFDTDDKHWECPAGYMQVVSLMPLVMDHRFEVDDDFFDWASDLALREGKAVEASRAKDADIEVTGLGGVLRPYQKAGVVYALDHPKTFIADGMRLGKTCEAIATIQAAKAYPALVICPATNVLSPWMQELRKWLPGKRICALGIDYADYTADVFVVNYEKLAKWEEESDSNTLFAARGRKKVKRGDKKLVLAPILRPLLGKIKGLIADESHYIKEPKSQRSRMVKLLAERCDRVLLLTGTPVINRPSELIHPLQVLGLLDTVFGGYQAFRSTFCDPIEYGYTWDKKHQDNILGSLNLKLRGSCYIRRTKEEVVKELPPKQRTTVPMEIDNRREYESAERDVISFVARKAVEDESFVRGLQGLDIEKQKELRSERYKDAEVRAKQAEALVRIEALKKLTVKGMMKGIVAWVEDFLADSNEKLVLFAYHIDIQNELAKHFPGCAQISGEDSQSEREKQRVRFQTDPNCRLCVSSLKVGTLGIELSAASTTATCELLWSPADHDQAEERVWLADKKNPIMAYYLIGSKTIQVDIAELIERKREIVKASTEGGKVTDMNVFADLLKRLRERST